MPGVKRTRERIAGENAALEAARRAGRDVHASRHRRRLTQAALAARVGPSRARLADIERGRGENAPLPTWFALGETLGRPFRAEFLRDRLEEPADAGHLAIQELVLRLAFAAGYRGGFELPTRPSDPSRAIDVPLIDRRNRRLAIVECWNSFGDLGAAARSSNRKLADADALAMSLDWAGEPYEIGLCWVVRDTARNRELIARYEHIFNGRFPGSSAGWVRALMRGGPLPADGSGVVRRRRHAACGAAQGALLTIRQRQPRSGPARSPSPSRNRRGPPVRFP